MNTMALLLDIDGTLVDSYEGVIGSYLYTLEKMGYSHPENIELRTILGPPMQRSLERAGIPPEDIEQARTIYTEHYLDTSWKEVSLYPGILDFLHWAKDNNFLLTTATSKGETSTHMVLDLFGITDLFTFIGNAGDNSERPTKTDVIAYTLDNINYDRNYDRAIMIGDRIHDYEGAKNNGIESIAVEWGFGSPEEYTHAFYQAKDPHDLERILNEWR